MAACVFDVGSLVRQHAGYSGDENRRVPMPKLGFVFISHLRTDALSDAVDALGNYVFGRRGGVSESVWFKMARAMGCSD